jgi:hypothetical protein
MINLKSAREKIHTAGTNLLGQVPSTVKAKAVDYWTYGCNNKSDVFKAICYTGGVTAGASIASSQASIATSEEIQTQVEIYELMGG